MSISSLFTPKSNDDDMKDDTEKDKVYDGWKKAIESGNESLAAFYIKEYPNIDMFDHYWDSGDYAIHIAVKNKKPKLVTFLIRNGADVNEENIYNGNSSLHYAILNKDEVCINVLLQNNADVLKMNNENQSPLTIASKYKDKSIYRLFTYALKSKSTHYTNPDAVDKDEVDNKEKMESQNEEENVQYDPLKTQYITLLGKHKKYLHNHQNKRLDLKYNEIGKSEIFQSIPIGFKSNTVALQPFGTDKYLCCDNKPYELKLTAHRRDRELWRVEKDVKTGLYAFKSFHNTYLCAETSGKAIANRKWNRSSEKWKVEVITKPDSYKEHKAVENKSFNFNLMFKKRSNLQ